MILSMYQMHHAEIVLAQGRIAFQNVLLKKETVVHLECPAKPDQKVRILCEMKWKIFIFKHHFDTKWI